MSAARARSALGRLVPDIAPPDDASPLVSTFLRGLAIGALVGAAIAGSAILGRRRSRDDDQAAPVEERRATRGPGHLARDRD